MWNLVLCVFETPVLGKSPPWTYCSRTQFCLQKVQRVDPIQAHTDTQGSPLSLVLTRIFCVLNRLIPTCNTLRYGGRMWWNYCGHLTPPNPFYSVNFAAVVLAQVCLKVSYLMNLEPNAQQWTSAAYLCAVTCVQTTAWHWSVSKDVGTFPMRTPRGLNIQYLAGMAKFSVFTPKGKAAETRSLQTLSAKRQTPSAAEMCSTAFNKLIVSTGTI